MTRYNYVIEYFELFDNIGFQNIYGQSMSWLTQPFVHSDQGFRYLKTVDTRNKSMDNKWGTDWNVKAYDGLQRLHIPWRNLLTASTFGRYVTTSTKRDNFCGFLFALLYVNLHLETVRKEFAPSGSKFFPSRVNPFAEAMQSDLDRVVFPESVAIFRIFRKCGHFSCNIWTLCSRHPSESLFYLALYTEEVKLQTTVWI